MPKTDSQKLANDDVEKLFYAILPHIPKVVGQVCASLNLHPGQMELDGYAQRIVVLLIDDDLKILRSFDHRSEPETWLYRIVWRHISHWLREQKRVVSLEALPPDFFIAQPNQEERIISKERTRVLLGAVGKLTEHDRKLFRLICQGLKTEKIAKEMGIKKRSVSREKVALIKRLQKIIKAR
jgi:RNA polymerase sigma factor (sigma-70 family)